MAEEDRSLIGATVRNSGCAAVAGCLWRLELFSGPIGVESGHGRSLFCPRMAERERYPVPDSKIQKRAADDAT